MVLYLRIFDCDVYLWGHRDGWDIMLFHDNAEYIQYKRRKGDKTPLHGGK